MEAVRTIVIDTNNVLTAAIDEEGVKSVTCLSIDKATYPTNVIGVTEANGDKAVVDKSCQCGQTNTICASYGNVIRSYKSVVAL